MRDSVPPWVILAAIGGLLLFGFVTPVQAQRGRAPHLLQAAREQYDGLNFDSAAALADAALGANPSPQERAWAFALRALVRLARREVVGARQDFVRGYETDARLMADSFRTLADLDSDAATVMGEARQAYLASSPAAEQARAQPEALTATPVVSNDTTLNPRDGRLRVSAVLSRRATVIFRVTPADVPTQLLWTDTLPPGSAREVSWDLRGRDGALVAPGRYALHVSAVDSSGGVSAPIQRVLTVERMPADTQALPPPLAASEFRPDTVRTRGGSATSVLLGAAFAAAAAALPTALGRPEINSGLSGDGTAYVAAGSVALAGVIGFLAGERVRYAPENVQYNEELRQQDVEVRARITEANTLARERAPVRVRREGGP